MKNNQALSSYYIFNAVAETGNFSKAAQTLGISQPAVSRALKKMEETLQTKLYTRESHGVTLTKEGRSLYERTNSAFKMLTFGKLGTPLPAEGNAVVILGVEDRACEEVLGSYISSFQSSSPGISVSTRFHSSSSTFKALLGGTADLGFIKEQVLPAGLSFIPVAEIQESISVRDLKTGTVNKAPALMERKKLGFVFNKSVPRTAAAVRLTEHATSRGI